MPRIASYIIALRKVAQTQSVKQVISTTANYKQN
jgi:glutamate dehydrogenase (NAD(P)+)